MGDYKHVIHAFIKKPGAFRFCKYRNEILPNDTYRTIWKYLDNTEARDIAPKIMLRILKLSADYDCEFELGQKLLSIIHMNRKIDINKLEIYFNGSNPVIPEIKCLQHSIADYDKHITGNIHEFIGGCYASV